MRHHVNLTSVLAEFRDSRILARSDRDDDLHHAGVELGKAEAESDLCYCVERCMDGAPADECAKLRHFVERFTGFLSASSYDDLAAAIRTATGVGLDSEDH